MNLTACTHDAVLHVAMNMRERDKQEIYALRWAPNPFLLMNDVMAQQQFAWVAWLDGKPCCVFGGAPMHPGVWSMFMFATDDFPRLGLGMTRFALKTCIPKLWEIGARRLQCDSHRDHVDAHRWLAALGCRVEGVKRAYGKDGADYLTFVLLKEVDKPDNRC